MNKEPENSIIPESSVPSKTIMQSAKDFVSGVLSPLKGKDMSQLLEDFTSEMTLVAEGLSEDQQKLTQETERLSAQQTELEQRILDGFHDTETDNEEMRKEIRSLKARLDKAEKALQDKKHKKGDGLASVLKQATWLVGILAGAWVLVTLINFFKP